MAIIVKVNGAEVEFPDSMTPEQIEAVIGGQSPPEKPAAKSSWQDPVRAGLQGATFGWADEIGSAVAAPFAAMATGNSMGDAYRSMQSDMDGRQRQYRDENPGAAITAELAGGIMTGGVGGAKVLGSQAVKGMAPIAKAGVTSLLGAAEGGIYGAGQAQQGERMGDAATGAAVGAVAAPLLGASANWVGGKAGDVAGYFGRKATETPKGQAVRLLRDTAEGAGLSVDNIANRYNALGRGGTLLDIDDTMRGVGRGIFDQGGPMRSQARNFVDSRQMGQIDRLKDATRGAISGDDAVDTVKALIKERSDKASPLYQTAMQAPPTGKMLGLVDTRGTLKSAIAKGRKMAADMGDNIGTKGAEVYDFKQFHYAKMAIDDDIGKAMRAGEGQKVRALMTLKNDLLSAMDEASPDYAQARQIFADESALIGAVDKGRQAFKPSTTVRMFNDMTESLTDGELEMFRRGAVQSILETLDNTQFTHDSAKKLVNTPAMQQKLSKLFKSPDDAVAFITQAGREAEFTKTRNSLYGSMTSSNQQAGQNIGDTLNSGTSVAFNAGTGNWVGAAMETMRSVFGKKAPSPEMLNEAASLLMKQGLTRDQIGDIFNRTGAIQAAYSRVGAVAPQATYGAVAPAYQPLLGGNQ